MKYDYYGNHTSIAIMRTVKNVHRQCKTFHQCMAAGAAFDAARRTAYALQDAYDSIDWVVAEHYGHIGDYANDMRLAAHKAARRKLNF